MRPTCGCPLLLSAILCSSSVLCAVASQSGMDRERNLGGIGRIIDSTEPQSLSTALKHYFGSAAPTNSGSGSGSEPISSMWTSESEDKMALSPPTPPNVVSVPLYRYEPDSSTEAQRRELLFGKNAPKRESPDMVEGRPHLATHMGYGTHYVDMFVGSPAQKQTLALSMMSLHTGFPCKGCDECGDHKDGFFDHFESADTFSFLHCGECTSDATCSENYDVCEVSDVYLDHMSSWSAFQARDVIYIGDDPDGRDPLGTDLPLEHGFEAVFGCQTSLKGYFSTNVADGLLSIAPTQWSFVNQMHRAGKLPRAWFSLCFNHQLDEGPGPGRSAGAVTLGGIEPAYHSSPLLFVKNVNPGRAYTVHVERVYLRPGGDLKAGTAADNQDAVPVSGVDYDFFNSNSVGRGVVIDSGAPYTSFDAVMGQAFRRAWKETVGTEYTNKRLRLTGSQLRRLPTVLLQLRAHDINRSIQTDPSTVPGLAASLDPESPYDVLVAFPPTAYMELDKASGYYESRMFFDGQAGSVLGANFLQGHDLVFDLEEHKIGFAEISRCEVPDEWTISESVSSLFTDEELFTAQIAREDDMMELNQGKCTAWCHSGLAAGYVILVLAGTALFVLRRKKLAQEDSLYEFEGQTYL